MLKRRIFYLALVLLVVSFAVGAQALWENVDDVSTKEAQKVEIHDDEVPEETNVEEDVVALETDAMEAEDVEVQDAELTQEKPVAETKSAANSSTEQAPKDLSSTQKRTALANRSTANEDKPKAPKPTETPSAPTPTTERTITYENYTVKSGDTLWLISQDQGIPLPELLKTNNLSENSPLTVGMILSIPRHQIPRKETLGANFGELLDWWTEAQYVWPIGKNARVTDLQSGKSFMVRRSYGAFHADVEPVTAQDTQIMQEIWGGWSWTTRPVIVEVDGRRLAASANGMPHSIQTITNNNFNGHFCIHFQNSTRHADNLQQADHQQNVLKAAGR